MSNLHSGVSHVVHVLFYRPLGKNVKVRPIQAVNIHLAYEFEDYN